jgi:hypothetical protein
VGYVYLTMAVGQILFMNLSDLLDEFEIGIGSEFFYVCHGGSLLFEKTG